MKKNLRKFFNNKLAVVGLVVILVMVAACIVGALMHVDYNTPDLRNMKSAPSALHWFGTDTIGRDLFARVLYGGCYSILIGVFCAVASNTSMTVFISLKARMSPACWAGDNSTID